MKKIVFILVISFLTFINSIYAENPFQNDITNYSIRKLNANPKKTFYDNLYQLALSMNEGEEILMFSESLSSLNVRAIQILRTTDNSISFTVDLGTTLVNGNPYSLNEKEFSITFNEDYYILSSNSEPYTIKYLPQNNEFNFVNNGDEIAIQGIDMNRFNSETPNNIFYYTEILNEFVKVGLVRDTKPIINEGQDQRLYQGTGVGFHSNAADAEFFCNKDKDRILQLHPGWWSPGVSITCAFGSNHFCVCTANFYSGTAY